MDFMYGPIDDSKAPTGFEPLEWDDGEYDDEDDAVDEYDPYEDEDEYEEPGLGGFDDLKPFTSFDDEASWDGGYL